MSEWAALDETLAPQPLFVVEAPDGRKEWAEIARQRRFINLLRMIAPTLTVWANANAGKRNPAKARQEGIMSGVFDVAVASGPGTPVWHAYPEFKGYDARGRAGGLSNAQIDWGNRMFCAGHHVACFFDPENAVEWIRSICPEAFIDRRGRL